MKTNKEIKTFFDEELKPFLDTHEEKRVAYLKKRNKVFMIIALIEIPILLYAFLAIANIQLAIVAIALGLALGFILLGTELSDFKKVYKRQVIARIVKFIEPGLNYRPSGCITRDEYSDSQIFLRGHDRYNGEDLVEGTYGKTRLKFSELKTQYKTTSTNSKGHRRTTWHTIFDGLFFMADFNKDFSCRVIVLPDTAQKLFGFLGQKLQSWNFNRDELVKLENVEFEENFVVYSDDQVGARYILSPKLMERIVELKKRMRTDIYLSFIHSKVNIAIPMNVNLFEPNTNMPLNKFSAVREFFYDLIDFIEIVDDLELNTRIWTKA